MGPEGASLADTSLHLIDDEVNAKLLSNILETLGEFCRNLIVTTFAHDWLDDYGDNLGALLFAPLRNFSAHIS